MASRDQLGAVFYEQAIVGYWPVWPDLPNVIYIRALGGARFERTWLFAPRHGAVASYREATCTWSRHLYVLTDGSWVIDHLDQVRPHVACGVTSFVEHDVVDNGGKAIGFLGALLAGGLIGVGIGAGIASLIGSADSD